MLQRRFQTAAFRVLVNKVLQAQQETREVCDKTIFNATIFHRFHVGPFEHFTPQLNDHSDSDFVIQTLPLHLLNRNHSLDTLNDQVNSHAEKLRNEVIGVFTQTEFENSSETEFSPKLKFLAHQRYLSSPQNFPNLQVFLPLKFDADDECSAKNDTLNVNYASFG